MAKHVYAVVYDSGTSQLIVTTKGVNRFWHDGAVYLDGDKIDPDSGPGLDCFPGGHRYPQEDDRAAAARELFEQTGLDVWDMNGSPGPVAVHDLDGNLSGLGDFYIAYFPVPAAPATSQGSVANTSVAPAPAPAPAPAAPLLSCLTTINNNLKLAQQIATEIEQGICHVNLLSEVLDRAPNDKIVPADNAMASSRILSPTVSADLSTVAAWNGCPLQRRYYEAVFHLWNGIPSTPPVTRGR